MIAEEVAIIQEIPLEKIGARLNCWDPGIDPSHLRLISMQRVTWNNGALGCPMPDKYYTQALVSGYILWLEHDSFIIEVHTDQKFQSLAIPGFGAIYYPPNR